MAQRTGKTDPSEIANIGNAMVRHNAARLVFDREKWEAKSSSVESPRPSGSSGGLLERVESLEGELGGLKKSSDYMSHLLEQLVARGS